MGWIGIGLIGVGVVWESVLAPSVIGWGFVLVGFVALLVPERRWPCRTPLDWPVGLLAVMGGVSLLVTPLPEVTGTQVMRLWAGLAGFYGLVNWAKGRRGRVRLAAAGLVVGGVGLALVAPVGVDWNLTKGIPIPDGVYELFPVLLSNTVHPNVMAALMVMLLPLPLAWFLSSGEGGKRGERVMRVALGAATLGMGLVLVLTKSRGGYLAGAVGVLLALWLCGWRRAAAVLTVLAIGLTIWLLMGVGQEAPQVVEGATDPSTWAFRQQVWRAAGQMVVDFSFTGAGMGAFNDVASVLYAFHETQNPGAHNLYLQVGVGLGFPGLIAVVAVLASTVWMGGAAMRAYERQGEEALRGVAVGALAGVVALMAHGLVNITVWGTRAGFVLWLLVGLVTAVYMDARSYDGTQIDADEHR